MKNGPLVVAYGGKVYLKSLLAALRLYSTCIIRIAGHHNIDKVKAMRIDRNVHVPINLVIVGVVNKVFYTNI